MLLADMFWFNITQQETKSFTPKEIRFCIYTFGMFFFFCFCFLVLRHFLITCVCVCVCVCACMCVWAQQAGVGMDAPLVDVEGFPLPDVDLYKVRTARHNISCEYIFHLFVRWLWWMLLCLFMLVNTMYHDNSISFCTCIIVYKWVKDKGFSSIKTKTFESSVIFIVVY